MASTQGSDYLARRLNDLLLSHIRTRLPDLQHRISTSLTAARTELADFGDSRLEGSANQGALVLQVRRARG